MQPISSPPATPPSPTAPGSVSQQSALAPLKPIGSAVWSALRWLLRGFDPIKWVIVAGLVVLAVMVWSFVRTNIVEPFDDIVTERQCLDHGEEIERELLGWERSNRFGLFDRSVGFCRFGDGPNGEAPITLTLADTEPGHLFQGAKAIGIIIQLGIVSIFLRLTVEPVLDFYRHVRARLT